MLKKKIGRWVRSKRFWKRLVLAVLGVPTLLLAITLIIVYQKQDELVRELIEDFNADFVGSTSISDSHISMFANFPYISIDLEDLEVHEGKDTTDTPILRIEDTYFGFNLWTILTGDMEIKKIKLENGHIDLVEHTDGQFNIIKALSPEIPLDNPGEEFHLDLKKIELKNIDLTKLNETNGLKVEAFITSAKSKFVNSGELVHSSLEAQFVLNLIKDGDTTFLRHKHIDLSTEVDFLKGVDILKIQPTTVKLEEVELKMEGEIDFLKDMDLDLKFTANNPNFDLLIALAPEEFIPRLKQFENSGDIYIEATIKGPSINGNNPLVEAVYDCTNGIITNPNNNRSIKNLVFSGYFTNGEERTMEDMEFAMDNFSAQLGREQGNIQGDIFARDFKAPDLKVRADTRIDLAFITAFLELENVKDVTGDLIVNIGFHDIIDLENPHHAATKLNENYNLSLLLENVGFKYADYALPFENLNLDVEMHGHTAEIEEFGFNLGSSDIHVVGTIDDLPAILHHTDVPIDTRLIIFSNKLNLYELTGSDSSAIQEELENVELDFDFMASARSFTESKYLPQGEFFIKDMHADLKNYPHRLHDFHADIFIDERDFRVVDFKGMVDESDFLFTGKIEHYEKWLDEHPGGDSRIEFNLISSMLQLESLFTYEGKNYVPEEYRHEEFDDLKIHGFTYLHFDEKFRSMDLTIDKFSAKMKVHPLRFEDFEGRIHYEDEHLIVEDFHGKLGHSKFKTTLHYYFGEDESVKKRDNYFSLVATRLDLDQLIKYNPAPQIISGAGTGSGGVDHDGGFNIYELPFTDMTYYIDIDHFNYHRFLFKNLKSEFRTTPDHYIYVENMEFNGAGGHFDVKGYFNGSDPDLIYFSPTLTVTDVDLDKLMFKFDNFGQDHLVSENLHGKFTGTITGKIHMHNDLVPNIDDSEIHMDVDVTHGRLENYALLQYMSDYFKDKNLNKIVFDTLNNHIDLVDGTMTIPKMIINSSLGHLEISGKQDLLGNMEYYIRVPIKMVTRTAFTKLFGRKKREEDDNEDDEIIYGTSRTRYVNIKMISTSDGYKFSLGKERT
ncbi:MAG: AsmA-like C-terminal region-containing protein [Crocinitomicaceae bacterium]|nr:AsmA-like C-terminal region-containing protein [Crocinitomicaceae bacterium]